MVLVLPGELQFRLAKGLSEWQVFFEEEGVCICVGISQGESGQGSEEASWGGGIIFCKQKVKTTSPSLNTYCFFNIKNVIFNERLLEA